MSNEVVQTMIIYDDRFVKYNNDFYTKKVVHQPFLKNYLEAVVGQYDENTVIHVILYDHKDNEGKTYIGECLDILNQSNIVTHIINPRSYYMLPDSPKIYYYIELGKTMVKRRDKIKELMENDPNKDNVMLSICEDYRAITMNYAKPDDTNGG